MIKKIKVSSFDLQTYKEIRKSVSQFLSICASKHDGVGKKILDIAPQTHEGAIFYFKKGMVETLDIDSNSKANYIADITINNRKIIKNNYFDIIVCTEVLEHTLNPFLAVTELYRILKKGGILLVTVPFNFRIHGPLPDCWRFTEYGLKVLFKKFSSINLSSVNTPCRDLMPLHYRLVVKK